ncbi:ABC transporter ATP-binding protein [Segeticoccus rhizosphaerae]|jgi:multiple sugar transport system ATP-binding protein|uniref:ABC transporter ATP-binding protein n=1 Tax=Segeticoccus rhizosphaerae TaxID=1104777 RepID=UPI0010C057FD|nr:MULTISPECIES: ABC transporter ATP-binding protein [Intrasporangiaceae]
MAIVEVRDLRKEFGGTAAVDGINLVTEEGEYLVLLGPSGCGKTTLLRLLAGLERPTGGDVVIGGEVVTDLPPRARKIAMVFQSYALYPHKTVRKNIVFPLAAAHVPKSEWAAKVEWAAGILGIQRLLDRRPRELSGGERQRVALARAMVREPQVFLFDEPLSNLDAKLRTSARDELKEFQRRVGITTVYVTHDQVEAMGLGDRIAVLNAGQIQQIGTPEEIYSNPATTFVATFVGAPPMNIIRTDGKLVGFRPENLLPLEAVGSRDDQLVCDFEISRVENLGSDRYVYGSIPALDPEAKVIAKLPSTLTVVARPDTREKYAVELDKLRYFDPDTGERVAPDQRTRTP